MRKVDFSKYTTIDPVENSLRIIKKHQEEAVYYLLERDYAILAYDMGLGKSLAAIVSALELNKKILIVCPASLKYNWLKELSYFFDKKIINLEDVSIINPGKPWVDNKIVIVNYDLLKKFHEVKRGKGKRESNIIDSKFDIMICDEAHLAKNPKSIRGKTLQDISKFIPKVWLLTGTPITNKPIDLYQLLKICRHETTHNYMWFIKTYCDAKQTDFGWDTSGASNLSDLYFRIKNVLSRKRKEECLDLPGKEKIPLYFDISKKKIEKYINKYYLETEQKIKEAIRNKDEESPYYYRDISASMELVEITLERKFCAEEMIPFTIEHAENIVDQDKKVVIFTNFTFVIDAIKEHFGNVCLTLDGRVKNSQKKQEIVDQFQSDKKIKILVANLISGGVGITLTKSSDVIFNDLHYRPDYHAQAEDRCYRMGQKEFVNCYYMLFENTISSIIYNILIEKQIIINQILEGKSDVNQKMSNLDEIIHRWKEGIFTRKQESLDSAKPKPVIDFNIDTNEFEINL